MPGLLSRILLAKNHFCRHQAFGIQLCIGVLLTVASKCPLSAYRRVNCDVGVFSHPSIILGLSVLEDFFYG